MRSVSRAPGPRISSGWARIASATRCRRRCLEPRERVRHPLERQREGDDAAAVDRGLDPVGVELRSAGDLGEHRLLARVLGRR